MFLVFWCEFIDKATFLALLCDLYGVTGVACITGALLAKRSESGISERSETCAKRETRGGEK